MSSSDNEWEKWGISDPYFGVITNEKFRINKINDELKVDFFESGRIHVKNVLEVSRRYLDSNFLPKKILDFGCGVGRLIIPFSEIAENVVGLDISESMLKEAQKNCEEFSIKNVNLIKSDDNLSLLSGKFDLIHSFIVFQHINAERGLLIFKNLITLLEDGGICAIHFIYSHAKLGKDYRLPPFELKTNFYKLVKKHLKKKIIRNQPLSKDPEMQMNLYNLDELLLIIQSKGIKNININFTNHDDVLGVFLYFQNNKED